MAIPVAKIAGVSAGTGLFLLAMASLWDLEEPSKWHTLACLACVTAVGYSIISLARRLGIVSSSATWGLAFLGKLFITVLIVKFSWMLPLDNFQRSATNADQLAYDLYGQELAEARLSATAVENMARGDTKAMFWYVGWIYHTFGVSTLYVGLVNCLWPLITFLSLAGILGTFSPPMDWQALRWGLFFPETSFYDSAPGKDSIVIAATYFALLCFLMLKTKRGARVPFVILTVGSMCVLGWFRPDMTVATLAIPALYWFFENRTGRLKGLLLLAAIALAGFYATPIGRISIEAKIMLARDSLINNESEDPARRGVLSWLNATSPADMALKTPLRSLVFLYGPYPRILPDADRLKSIGSDLGIGIQELYQKLSALAIIAATPWIAVALFLKGAQERSLARFLAAAVIVLLLAGSSASLLIHLRYRTQLDPALCAAALVGYRHSKRPKHAFHWYLLCLAGSVIYYLWLA